MLGMSAKQPFGLQEAKFSGLPPSGSEAMRRVCLPAPQLQGNIFGSFDESLLARAEALAAADLVSLGKSHHPFKPDATYHTMSGGGGGGGPCTAASAPASLPILGPAPPPSHHHHHHHHQQQQQQQQQHHHPHHNTHHHHAVAHLDGGGGDLLDHLSPALMGGSEHGAIIAAAAAAAAQIHPHDHPHLAAAAAMGHLHQAMASMGHPPPPPAAAAAPASTPAGLSCLGESESDPRELEAFAERFKQRRIKLGVTQADVGSALGSLKIPGVGSLSQSTICRFESLTLSHNNMIALRPVLRAWLDEAEAEAAAARAKGAKGDGPGMGVGPGGERKRKRTSIAAPEKRSLEAYFALQPRPSSEKVAAIAEKLELKKNVVRVWFCNQRQKQKRMKYSAVH